MRAVGMPEVPEARVAEMTGGSLMQLLQDVMGEDGATEAAALFRSCYLENLCDRTTAYPGIPEMLAATSLPKVVVANKPTGMARRILAELGLIGYFERVLGEDDMDRQRPDPRALEALLQEYDVSPPQAVLIGDSMVDAGTAREVGIPFCAVSWGYTPRATLAAERPDFLVDTLPELETLLNT